MPKKIKKFLDFMISDAITVHFGDWSFTISWSAVLGFIVGLMGSRIVRDFI